MMVIEALVITTVTEVSLLCACLACPTNHLMTGLGRSTIS